MDLEVFINNRKLINGISKLSSMGNKLLCCVRSLSGSRNRRKEGVTALFEALTTHTISGSLLNESGSFYFDFRLILLI